MRAEQGTLPKPSIKDSRVLTYLGVEPKTDVYVNTEAEAELVILWNAKYQVAKQEFEKSRANSASLKRWRDAYLGNFYELDEKGVPTDIKLKPLRKVAFELVEQKVNPHIPAPVMTPRYQSDIIPVEATENLIKHEMDRMLSEETQDESEHSCLIDSTSWFKVTWDPFDNTHERSGMPVVESCPIDTVFPQPGINNYKKLDYIFHRRTISIAQLQDLYNRQIPATEGIDTADIVEVYYLNQDRHVGRFVYTEATLTVLANDLEWGMRRRRECVSCTAVVTIESVCPTCGGKDFHYVGVKEQILTEDLLFVTNPYRTGENKDPNADQNQIDENRKISAGTKIPFYLIKQLPFIPKRTIKVPNDIYGVSEVELGLEPQDAINKFLGKALRKSAASRAWVTKLKDTNIDDSDSEISFVEVETAEESNSIQVKQVMADIQQELTMAEILYQGAKSTTGVTDTDQGKSDPSARSGKAKQMQLMASQSRLMPTLTQRNVAYAGVYELMFKYLLAFSDEERSFVKVLPDGTSKEEVWSKYMFLSTDKNGEYYYRDDFAWSVDQATEITHDRATMWQMIDNDFLNGTMGTTVDPLRALRMYWHMKQQAGYPNAKFALAFLDDALRHLPSQIEQALVNNPEAVQLAMSYIKDMQDGSGAVGGAVGGTGGTEGAGGARNGAGKPASGETHEAQQKQANNQQRAGQGQQTNTVGEKTGGVSGGTK